MLEGFVNFICAFILCILGFYFIKRIKKSNKKINHKIILVFLLNSIAISIIRTIEPTSFTPIISFIINILTYKIVFKQTIEESILETGILTLFVIISDVITAIALVSFFRFVEYRNNYFIYIIINIIIAILPNLLLLINQIPEKLNNFLNVLLKNNSKLNGVFLFLTMLASGALSYKAMMNYNLNYKFIGDIAIIVSLVIMGIIFINNKNIYHKLSNEYDILLSSVSTFEEWIEKEQFTRHEYKNQLAVIYALSSEKEVKKKIEEIIDQNLNIKDEEVNHLKDLPKGGLKGLLYYKTIVAENNKLKITVDVSIKEKGILQKLSKSKINSLAKIIGILYDNAIDAAKESKKKILLLEIYELKDRVNIVISNTFKKTNIVNNRYEKGVSTKGKGHGNGLYYLSNILSNNTWIEEKQEIIDNYYIVTITIKKNTSKK